MQFLRSPHRWHCPHLPLEATRHRISDKLQHFQSHRCFILFTETHVPLAHYPGDEGHRIICFELCGFVEHV